MAGVNQVRKMTPDKFYPGVGPKYILVESFYPVRSLPASWESESTCCENISPLTFGMATCLVSNFRCVSVYHAGRGYPHIFFSVRRIDISYPCSHAQGTLLSPYITARLTSSCNTPCTRRRGACFTAHVPQFLQILQASLRDVLVH